MELFSMPFFLGDPHNFEYVRFWISVELERRNTGSGAYEPAQLIDWRELRVGGVKALPRNGVKQPQHVFDISDHVRSNSEGIPDKKKLFCRQKDSGRTTQPKPALGQSLRLWRVQP